MPVAVPSPSGFLVAYPEFATAPTAVVEGKLTEAADFTAEDFYGTAAAEAAAVYAQAAYLLSLLPDARAMRAADPKQGNRSGAQQANPYAERLYRLQRSAAVGWRVF
jgi:hypothetical protein